MTRIQNAQNDPDYLKQFRSRPKRFVLPLVINKRRDNLVTLNGTTCQVKLIDEKKLWIDPELIVDLGCELPQLDHFRFDGQYYRYFYAINSDIDYRYCGAVCNQSKRCA
jgi:carotenoid isomerooxygenase